MTVDRMLPTREAEELLALTRDLADRELRPRAAACEAAEELPDGLFRTLGEAGLLALPFPEELAAASPASSACRCSRSLPPAGLRWP